MTYLELVNGVLRRLREEEVTSVGQETYSKMIGDFVNDSKKIVEKSWDWSGLKTTISVATEADKYNYSLLVAKMILRQWILLTTLLVSLSITVLLSGFTNNSSIKLPLMGRRSTTPTTVLTPVEILK